MKPLRLANPLVRPVLRSRAHRLLSGRLLILRYRGHRSGRAFEIPLLYAVTPTGELVVLALRHEKLWWRSFRRPTDASVILCRRELPVSGGLATGEERDAALSAYLARHRYARRRIHSAAVVVLRPRR